MIGFEVAIIHKLQTKHSTNEGKELTIKRKKLENQSKIFFSLPVPRKSFFPTKYIFNY